MFACLYQPLASRGDHASPSTVRHAQGTPVVSSLAAIAQQFSPRYEQHRADLVSIDVSGLERMFLRRAMTEMRERDGAPRSVWRTIGEELRRAAASRGIRVHVAIAGTRTAAMVLAHARPGLTLVDPGKEAEALAPLPIGMLEKVAESSRTAAPAAMPAGASAQRDAHVRHQRAVAASSPDAGGWGPTRVGKAPREKVNSDGAPVSVLKSWGLRTLGELAALPPDDLAARLGQPGLVWQAIARGSDLRPLVPTPSGDRFEASIELEWPIDGLEALSFVLTRLLEPLSTRLERRDRGAAVLHVRLRLVTRVADDGRLSGPDEPGEAIESVGPGERNAIHARSLQLPAPIRDVRTLRTLALLDLESHPPAAAIDRVTVVIEPTPARVLQHTLYTRAQPAPEQLSTLVARLGALMGQDRIGAPATIDVYRPGAFTMRAFATEHRSSQPSAMSHQPLPWLVSALRRCRQPVPARVAVAQDRPVRVTTDRRGFAGGTVVQCAGPWRTSGNWWSASGTCWHRDEWDVALSDGAVYRIFRDRDTEGWFIDAIVD